MHESNALKVFISSTSEDLKAHRAVARDVILGLEWLPVGMEYMDASTIPTLASCLGDVARCQLMVLIVAWRKGWTPASEQGGDGVESITALEYSHARKLGIPVLILMGDDAWPQNLVEYEQYGWIKSFRSSLGQRYVTFRYEDQSLDEGKRLPDFRSKLRQTLVSYKESLEDARRRQAAPGDTAIESRILSSVRRSMQEGNIIPFLGCDLDVAAFRTDRESLDSSQSPVMGDLSVLASAAEYSERTLQSRMLFLEELQNVLSEQQRSLQSCRASRFVADLEVHPPLIISASYGQALEERLRELDRKFIVVSHVIRSADEKYDGKLLVAYPDGTVDMIWADELVLDVSDWIIYKPLGSPFLNGLPDAELEIDTVVITESDYLTFLTRLKGQKTGVPNMFGRLFQKYPLLFIGFGLDAWHYRLVVSVLRSPHSPRTQAGIRAVRIPATSFETLCWQRLNADLIPLTIEQFAEKVEQ